MKARIHAELKCEECNAQLSYHKDDFIKCNSLKCTKRGKLYHGPHIKLDPVLTEAEKLEAQAQIEVEVEVEKAVSTKKHRK
jgi:hypothetical protein